MLFDWGDTLFHAPHAPEVIVAFARSVGVQVSDARARDLWDEIWVAGKTPEEIAKGRDLSPEAHRRVWMDLFARLDRVVPGLSGALYERVMDPHSWVPFADTRATLEAVRRGGLKVGVVSNVPMDLRPVFAKHGLDRLVDSYTHSFEVGAEKPDPAIFLAAAKSLGVKPSGTLMVGDHEVDAGAERAGMRVFILPAEFDGDVRGLDRVLALLPS
jgi:HAD superfamily hydrolase (TIGR01509 family)